MSRNLLPTGLSGLAILFWTSEEDISAQVSPGRARYFELILELGHSFLVVTDEHIFSEGPTLCATGGE